MHLFFRRLAAVSAAIVMFFVGTALAATPHDPFHLLLIGTDEPNREGAARSDVMVLVQLRPQTGEVRLLSFLRDLYVQVPGAGRTRLNAAYYYGGAPLLRQTLENAFGVTIDAHIAVDFALMADLIDQVGGVEVDVTEAERKQLNDILIRYNKSRGIAYDNGVLAHAGPQTLMGRQALSFSRIRQIDSDFKRTDRQQQVLGGLVQKLRGFSASKLLWLAARNLPRLRTDLTMAHLAPLMPLLRHGRDLTLHSARVPFDGAFTEQTINGMMVLVPNLEANKAAVRRFLEQ